MILGTSKIFVSTKDFNYDYFTASDINRLINKEKELIYALSYHNGFKKFNYDELDLKEIKIANKKIYKLRFSNTVGRLYEVYMSNSEEIFTINKGYINVMEMAITDVYYDQDGNYCKLLAKPVEVKLDGSEVFYNVNVIHHKSFFLDGMLVRNIDN